MLSHFYYHWLPNYFVIEILSYSEAQATRVTDWLNERPSKRPTNLLSN